MLGSQQLADFERDGFLILETFVSHKDCDSLLARTAELVTNFEPPGQKSMFSTTEQEQTSDQYFLESGRQNVRGVVGQGRMVFGQPKSTRRNYRVDDVSFF